MANEEIVLGCTVTDKVTGFKGVVTGIVSYLTGCNQASVTPKVDKDGETKNSVWFDVQRLTRQRIKLIVLDNEPAPGFGEEPPAY